MRTRRDLRAVLLVLGIVTSVVMSACSSPYERSNKPAGDWSRGLLLGESNVKQAVALQMDASGHAHLLWVEALSDDVRGLHYAQIDRGGRVVIDASLTVDLPYPRNPQLLLGPDGTLHVGLLSRQNDNYMLYHGRLTNRGELSDLIALSRNTEDVESFQLIRSSADEVCAVWASELDDGQSGIYRVSLVSSGSGEPTLLVPDGADPFVLVEGASSDSSGETHLVWTNRTDFSTRQIYYATLEDGEVTPPGGYHVTTFDYAESATYQPPIIGLDSERVYLIWSVQNLGGGMTPTAADTYYISFAPGQQQYVAPRTLKLSADHRPGYEDHRGHYTISRLAPVSPDVRSTDYINAPAVVTRRESELPMVVSLIIESASKQFMQLAVTILADGEAVGYQIANETSNASVLPSLVADDDASLHLAWLDTAGFRRYKVFYATTSPEAAEWLNRTTVEDVGEQAADLAWGILSAIGFLPLTLMWNVPALVWLVVFYLSARQEHLDELGARIALGVSFALYLIVKTLFLPGLLSTGTPFVYLVPQEWTPALNTIIPLAILALAIVGLIIYLVRSPRTEPPTMFKGYLVFALVDSALTAILYAPRFFNPRG